jgi:hypothetical protein
LVMHSSYSSGDHSENLMFVFETLSMISSGAIDLRTSLKRSRASGPSELRKPGYYEHLREMERG